MFHFLRFVFSRVGFVFLLLVFGYLPSSYSTLTDSASANVEISNITIGMPLEGFKKQGPVEQIENTGRWQSYCRPQEKLVLASYPLTRITYHFFKEKLYSIYVDFHGSRATKGVHQWLETQYGKPSQTYSQLILKSKILLVTQEWVNSNMYILFKSEKDFAAGELIYLDKNTWDLLKRPLEQRQAILRNAFNGSFTNADF